MKILLTVSFLGTAYCGYQVQPNKPTVQRELNEAAKKLFGYDCDIVGCSRTDSGVHANMFCVAVSKAGEGALYTSVPTDKIPQAMSFYLPKDIVVTDAKEVDDGFHPRYDVKSKEYVYMIWNSPNRNPFVASTSWHCPKLIGEEGIENMKAAAQLLVGTHDFSSYMAEGSSVKDTVRTVFYANVEKDKSMIRLSVSADGFLYNMVRIITGTLLEVGYGKRKPEDIIKITESKSRAMAGVTAPPEGLFLNKVVY